MVAGFGGVITQLTNKQADYINTILHTTAPCLSIFNIALSHTLRLPVVVTIKSVVANKRLLISLVSIYARQLDLG
jgi:hypothetical protein